MNKLASSFTLCFPQISLKLSSFRSSKKFGRATLTKLAGVSGLAYTETSRLNCLWRTASPCTKTDSVSDGEMTFRHWQQCFFFLLRVSSESEAFSPFLQDKNQRAATLQSVYRLWTGWTIFPFQCAPPVSTSKSLRISTFPIICWSSGHDPNYLSFSFPKERCFRRLVLSRYRSWTVHSTTALSR